MRHSLLVIALAFTILSAGCSRTPTIGTTGTGYSSLGEVPAVRLNYRYEADVPPPEAAKEQTKEERNPAVQRHFDDNRPQEALDRTLTSPDSKRVLAIYHKATDLPTEFRLDMYEPNGTILNKVTSDTMAVHFPDTIRWSPDSSTVAFVAMVRGTSVDETAGAPAFDPETSTASNQNSATGHETIEANTNTNTNTAPAAAPTPAAPTGILTFRTEQIYIADAQGQNARAITQNEGLIYFYYVWSPDSTMLAALAAKSIEWRYLNDVAEGKGELFVPVGRPRVIEKNGRERRLDDAMTAVQPVWSPDSSKVACAFEHQVRLYDSAGTSPTQAAIPLRNNLLISSQAFDRELAQKLNAANIPTDANATGENASANANTTANATANANANQPTTLPNAADLVSFNPIVALNWTADDLLYFETAYIKRMKNEADSVTSYSRWHRLVLTAQPASK